SFVTVPLSVRGLVESNFARTSWCASSGLMQRMEISAATNQRKTIDIVFLLQFCRVARKYTLFGCAKGERDSACKAVPNAPRSGARILARGTRFLRTPGR